ncbi:uncharacterized protein, YkwD family [Natronincola peptidivorans]|uniref:Uncharacterized protein, YkwD family n=1 Tax=Natronincola peptidivorans TaxID=426128 RepID=A0A1H9YUK5_9FIRM|nr:CAP domain-containing protein [Natronincola peptidivorans]SES72347.1 uncharacterized protein, YkwD family [Natronincola peptidivorans]
MNKQKTLKKIVVPVLTTALLFSTVVVASASTGNVSINNVQIRTSYNITTTTTFNNGFRFNITRFQQTPQNYNFNYRLINTTPDNNVPSNPTQEETPVVEQPVQPEPAPVQPEPAPVQPEPTPVQPEPTPVQPQPTPPTENTSNARHALTAAEIEMVEYVNQARSQAGLRPLAIDVDLSYVARVKSKDMQDNNYFSHTSPTYGSPFDMMRNFGIQYRAAAENIAINSSVRGAHNAFMNSEGHRNNIMNPNFTHIGIGIENRHYTQMFITK